MKYQMELNEFSYNKIKAGRKLDIRLFDKKRQSLKIGDIIEYTNMFNPKEHLECKVLGLAVFENFSDLIDCLTPQMIGYSNKEEIMVRVNRAYSPEQQSNFNVVAIFIRDVTPVWREISREENER